LRINDIFGSITDVQGNSLGDPVTSTAYTVFVPEPLNDPTNFQVSTTTTTSITLTWDDATGYPPAHGYLITAERNGATATPPADGNVFTNDDNLFDDGTPETGYMNVAAGIQTVTFTQLLSGVDYTFRIYPYTNSGIRRDYKTDTPAEALRSTPTA